MIATLVLWPRPLLLLLLLLLLLQLKSKLLVVRLELSLLLLLMHMRVVSRLTTALGRSGHFRQLLCLQAWLSLQCFRGKETRPDAWAKEGA